MNHQRLAVTGSGGGSASDTVGVNDVRVVTGYSGAIESLHHKFVIRVSLREKVEDRRKKTMKSNFSLTLHAWVPSLTQKEAGGSRTPIGVDAGQ